MSLIFNLSGDVFFLLGREGGGGLLYTSNVPLEYSLSELGRFYLCTDPTHKRFSMSNCDHSATFITQWVWLVGVDIVFPKLI